MMKLTREKRQKFLDIMNRPALTKNAIFEALFDVCGMGEAVNTKHVFFQEVIIKFNASKAIAVISKGLPYETESHFVDVAIYAYIRNGYDMKDFDSDLCKFKKKQGFIYTPFAKEDTCIANA